MGDTRLRSVRLPADLDERLVERAAELDRSVSWVIVRAVEQALADEGVAGIVRDGVARQRRAAVVGRVTGSPSLARFKETQNGT